MSVPPLHNRKGIMRVIGFVWDYILGCLLILLFVFPLPVGYAYLWYEHHEHPHQQPPGIGPKCDPGFDGNFNYNC